MRNKTEGNRYELQIIKEHKELGYTDCVSSRAESRQLDNDGIDVVSNQLPYYIQCKSSTTRPNYAALIKECKRKDRPLIIFHKHTRKAKTKFVRDGEYVLMTKEAFYDLIKQTVPVRKGDPLQDS